MVVSFVLLLSLGFLYEIQSLLPIRGSQNSHALEPIRLEATAGCWWRQTGGCDGLKGVREPGNDKDCTVTIDSGLSGYCECSPGVLVQYVNCSHPTFQCATYCSGTSQPTQKQLYSAPSPNREIIPGSSYPLPGGFTLASQGFFAWPVQVPGSKPFTLGSANVPTSFPSPRDKQMIWAGNSSAVYTGWTFVETFYAYDVPTYGYQLFIVGQNLSEHRIWIFANGITTIGGDTWTERLRFWAPTPPCLTSTTAPGNGTAGTCGTQTVQNGQSCTMACNKYYTGTPTRTCQADGTLSPIVGSCTPALCAWRQTGNCNAAGPREPQNDAACTTTIPSGASGYCECDGKIVFSGNCGHSSIQCSTFCPQPALYKVYFAPDPYRVQILTGSAPPSYALLNNFTFQAWQSSTVPGTIPITIAIPMGSGPPITDRQMAWSGGPETVCCSWAYKETFYAYPSPAPGRLEWIVAAAGDSTNLDNPYRIYIFGGAAQTSVCCGWTEKFRFYTPTAV